LVYLSLIGLFSGGEHKPFDYTQDQRTSALLANKSQVIPP